MKERTKRILLVSFSVTTLILLITSLYLGSLVLSNDLIETGNIISKTEDIDISDWKTYTNENNPDEDLTTSDWRIFNSTNTKTPYSIKYPNTWKEDFNTFNDISTDIKVAEPFHIISLEKEQTCYEMGLDGYNAEGSMSSPGDIQLSREDIKLNDLDGFVDVEKVYLDTNTAPYYWYPITYCLNISEEKALMAIFYKLDLPTDYDFNLFETILKTFRLE